MHIEFKQNVGKTDRIVRFLLSIALLLLAFLGTGVLTLTWSIVLGVIGILMLIEAASGY